jgi:hypothetical protein
MKPNVCTTHHGNRRAFIGGSDHRIIMGDDEAVLLRLWREKRGEAEPPDYSGNLIVQRSAWRPNISIGAGTSARPGRLSRTPRAGFAIP